MMAVKPDVFANNRISMQLVSTNPVSDLVGHVYVVMLPHLFYHVFI